MPAVSVSTTRVEMTQIVLPQHTNTHRTAFGGQIAAWLDICGSVSAQRFCRRPVVTASMDQLHFLKGIREGMVIVLRSQVNRAWRTSIEIGVRVDAEHPLTGRIDHCCSAYLTFVALDEEGEPTPVPELDCSDDPEGPRRFEEAGLRRDARLRMREERRKVAERLDAERGGDPG